MQSIGAAGLGKLGIGAASAAGGAAVPAWSSLAMPLAGATAVGRVTGLVILPPVSTQTPSVLVMTVTKSDHSGQAGTGAAFAVPAALGVAGFTTGGITAGSAAASFMASYGGNKLTPPVIILPLTG